MNRWERFKIGLKLVVSYLTLPIVLLIFLPIFYIVKRYRFRDVEALRAQFRDIIAGRRKRPLLICPNHLTWVDSVVLEIALIPVWQMFTHYSRVPWHVLDPINLPLLCPILKVIPIERMGDRKRVQLVKERIKYLLNKGDMVVIFPEGTRSDHGRVNTESYQYGVGDILKDIPDARVLCVYLRGDLQKVKSKLPPKGCVFDISMRIIHPKTSLEGMRASRDISGQIVSTLSSMEEEYFASHQDRK